MGTATADMSLATAKTLMGLKGLFKFASQRGLRKEAASSVKRGMNHAMLAKKGKVAR